MAEIILHPSHPDYCNECVYHGSSFGNCLSEDYNKNSYKVNCVWHYCPYKRKEKQEKIENALMLVLERLRKIDKDENDNKGPKHICTNCKYRNMEEGYDQQWGRYLVVKNWCGKDRELMDTSHGNDKHFSEPCKYFVSGDGVYHSMSKKEKRK